MDLIAGVCSLMAFESIWCVHGRSYMARRNLISYRIFILDRTGRIFLSVAIPCEVLG